MQIGDDGVEYTVKELFSLAELSPEKPFVLSGPLGAGTLNIRGISFSDNGRARYFHIRESGYDGSLIVNEPHKPIGVVHENFRLGIGMVFPYEYTGKTTVDAHDDFFVVMHTATNNLFRQGNEQNYHGTLFRVFKMPITDDSFEFYSPNAATLYQGEEYAVMLMIPGDVQFDADNMESPETKEFLMLSESRLIERIIDSTYKLENGNR